MRVFIPSTKRSKTISTYKLIASSPFFSPLVVVHNMDEANEYIDNGVPAENIAVSSMPYNISMQRNWILENLVNNGEWIAMLDDNIEGFNVFPEPYYHFKQISRERKELRIPLESHYPPIEKLEEVINQTIAKAEDIGANFCGFATIENYFFRTKKWKEVSMICSKACLIKKTHLRYDENVLTMDDYFFSALHLKEFGKVLVNSYVFPKAKHYQTGGLGTLKERGDKKIKDCAYLYEQFPGLFRYKDRKNSLPMAEVTLRGYSESFIEKWRKEQYGIN